MVHCIFIDGKNGGMPQFHIAVLMKRDNNINNRNQTYRIGWGGLAGTVFSKYCWKG